MQSNAGKKKTGINWPPRRRTRRRAGGLPRGLHPGVPLTPSPLAQQGPAQDPRGVWLLASASWPRVASAGPLRAGTAAGAVFLPGAAPQLVAQEQSPWDGSVPKGGEPRAQL